MCAFYSDCGDDFDEYIRRVVGPLEGKSRTVQDLWIGRNFRLHLQGQWRKGKVVEWCQYRVNPPLHWTEWTMVFELETAGGGSSNDGELPLKLRVNRMNIKGGGTLQKEGEAGLFSLEWIDAASPAVDLDDAQGVLAYKCPCCRAVEPIIAAHEQAAVTLVDECPVCLEIKECRVLGCKHGVCHSCWSSYRRMAVNIGVQLAPIDADELERERNKREAEAAIPLCERTMTNTFDDIVRETFSGEKQGLAHFWRELMVVDVSSFFHADLKSYIIKFPIDAIKILLQVLQERKEVLFAIMDGSHQEQMKEFVYSISFYCCDVISEQYRQRGSNRHALSWSQLAFFYARQARSRTLLAAAHVFLASMQQSVGMLTEAQNTYENSLGLGSSASDVWKYREDLLREVEQWTGSSGKLTPGC